MARESDLPNADDQTGAVEWVQQIDDHFEKTFSLRAVATEAWTPTSQPARLELWTTPNDRAVLEEVARLEPAGVTEDGRRLFVLAKGSHLLGLGDEQGMG